LGQVAGKDKQIGFDGLRELTCRKAGCRIDDIPSTWGATRGQGERLGVSVHNRTRSIYLTALASRSMNRSIAFGTFLFTLCHGRVRT
jgi:hypothetical protein